MPIHIYVKYVSNQQLQQFFSLVGIFVVSDFLCQYCFFFFFAVIAYQLSLEMLTFYLLQYVNLVRLLVPSVQFVEQLLRIGFLHSLDTVIYTLLTRLCQLIILFCFIFTVYSKESCSGLTFLSFSICRVREHLFPIFNVISGCDSLISLSLPV